MAMKMKSQRIGIIFAVLLFLVASCNLNRKPIPVCRVEYDRVVYRIDSRWNEQYRKEIFLQYNLDSAVFAKAFGNKRAFASEYKMWQIKKINSHVLELSRPIGNRTDSLLVSGHVLIFTGSPGGVSGLLPEDFGVNLMFRDAAFSYSNGRASFWLPDHHDAESVFLSGTFNSWSTSETAMTPCDSGWTVSIKIEPGKYAYKYIIDGNWNRDPSNSLKEDDQNGDFNSVIYCPDYVFRLKGREEAREVRLTGSFLNWSPTGLNMLRTGSGWELPIYLKEGTYSYKFISGKEWFTDPGNPDVRDDGKGNKNSFISIGELQKFALNGFTEASNVFLAGTFNNWRNNDIRMTRKDNGWTASIALSPGNYEYKFIVDGRWMSDPANGNTTGSGEYTNSIFSFKPNHTFILNGYQDAKEVMVTGSFNNFSNPGYRMSKKDGKWMLPLWLKPGKTIYKYIVDGQWILDPDNETWEDNEFGTGNSVIWIE